MSARPELENRSIDEREGFTRRRFIRSAGAAFLALPLAAACSGEEGTADAQSSNGGTTAAAVSGTASTNENVRLIERYYEAYGQGDLDALRNEFFVSDIEWRIPGHHPLSGIKRGADEVLAFFERLGEAGFRAETLTLASGGEWVIDLHRGWSTEGEGELDILWALAFRIADGRIAEAINFAFDQAAADSFFWANFPLAPIPERLANP